MTLRSLRGRIRDPRSVGRPIAIHTALSGLRRAVESFSPDVVHLTHDRWFLPNLQLALAAGERPVVFSPFFHPYATNITNFPQTLVNRITVRKAGRVTAVTEYEAAHLKRVYGVKDWQLAVFPQGVRGMADPEPAPRETRDRVLFVGRMDRVKGALLAAESFCSAADALPPGCRFVAVGRDWGELRSMEECFASNAMRDRFEHVRSVSRRRLLELYDRAVVCLLPSRVGAFGYPIFESLARGTPVVTLATPQSRELLTAGGVIVDTPDPVPLGRALADLLSDDDRWQRHSRAGWALARQRFTAEAMVRRMREQYVAAGA